MAVKDIPGVPSEFMAPGQPRLIMRHEQRIRDDRTGEAFTQRGKVIEFKPNGQGNGGRYVTDDPEEIDFLRNAMDGPTPHLGSTYFEVPPTPPDSAPIVAQVRELAEAGNFDEIREALTDERMTWERQDVILACEMALAAEPAKPEKK